MAGTAEHITAMVRSHAAGDDAAFYAVAGPPGRRSRSQAWTPRPRG